MEVFDGIRESVQADRSHSSGPQRAVLRGEPPGREGLAGPARLLLAPGDAGRLPGAVDCIKAFSETDFTEDLKKFDVPTLIIHGDDDQIVRCRSAMLSAKLVRNATLKVHPGAPHGLCSTHKGQVNADLLAFLKA